MGRMLCEPLSKEVLRHIVRITSSCTVDVMELKRAQRVRKPNIIEHTGSILIWQWSRTRSKLEGAALTGKNSIWYEKIGNFKGTFRSASRILKGTSSLPPRFAAPLRWSGRTSSDLSIWIELIRELNWTGILLRLHGEYYTRPFCWFNAGWVLVWHRPISKYVEQIPRHTSELGRQLTKNRSDGERPTKSVTSYWQGVRITGLIEVSHTGINVPARAEVIELADRWMKIHELLRYEFRAEVPWPVVK